MRYFYRSLFLLLLCLPSITLAGTLSWLEQERWVTVAKVYDGDTFQTLRGEKIRLLGINTPEIQHRDKPAQIGGKQAKQALKQLILGQQVRLRFDKEKKDRYGRTLAQVWLQHGLWVNAWLVQKGYAHVYTFEPNTRWCKKLLQYEQQARKASLGIWHSSRFKILQAKNLSSQQLGQFRVIQAQVIQQYDSKGWKYKLKNINLTVPKRYKKTFKSPLNLKKGQKIIIRGKIRSNNQNKLFLAIHSPYDLELVSP